MRKLCSLLLAAALLPALPAHAAPSLLHGGSTSPNFLGATGLLLTPSAYTVGDRGIAGDFYTSSNFESYGVTVGLGSRLEVGGSYINAHHHFADSGFLGNAKFNLLRESTLLPAISV